MKPTVGRVVHFYGELFRWKYLQPNESGCVGPFAATVVRVNTDGSVNLNVLYPSMCVGRGENSELVENVVRETEPRTATNGMGHWCWPPRSE